MICAGGCGQAVRAKVKYCQECSPVRDPEWRKARGRVAAAAAKCYHRARMAQAFAGMTSVEAGAHGYRVGYRRAYAYWHRWAKQREAQLLKELAELRKGRAA